MFNVGIVTKPFSFEGRKRLVQAEQGLEQLKEYVDSLIIVSNNKVLEIIGHIPFEDAFKEADNILRQGVQTITDLIAVPAMINLDFADIKSVMEGQGSALIGIGMASGENKAKDAATKAIQSPLLEAQITGAKSAIVNVTGGASMSAYDAQEAVELIRSAAGNDIDIIFGVAINDKIGESIIVTVIATGFDLPKATLIETDGPAAFKSPLPGNNVQVSQEDDGFGLGSISSVEDEDDSGIPNFFNRK